MDPIPLEHSVLLGRLIRTDGIDTLGTSTLTLFDDAVRAGRPDDADKLLAYFWDETLRIGEALFQWISDIISYRLEQDCSVEDRRFGDTVLRGIRAFEPSTGDRRRAVVAAHEARPDDAIAAAELGRVRYAGLHDAYVAWIQQLLADIADDFGEAAVCEVVVRAHRNLWQRRYAPWRNMTPIERLQLSVEGMRGHLSGSRRRGDVGVRDDGDRFAIVLDPCGSCGVLRRGDPDSNRPPADPAGNATPHPWSWMQTGKSWYSLHSPIVMEWLDMRDGRPPFRPLEHCDEQGPCTWYIYKDPVTTRPEHYERMGFEAPAPHS